MEDGLDRPTTREFTKLRPVWKFLAPYRWQVGYASVALVVTAAVTLSIGQGMRLVIDEGLSSGSAQILVLKKLSLKVHEALSPAPPQKFWLLI